MIAPGNKRLTRFFPLLFALAVIGGVLAGSRLSNLQPSDRFFIYPRKDKLSSLLELIEQMYVDTVHRSELVEMAIPLLLNNLDPHSVYIPANELAAMNEPLEGNFSGIGVQFNMQDDTVMIVSTVPGGPSEMVGILPGDRLVTVNDTVVAGMGMETPAIVSMLRGPRGTVVRVGVMRNGGLGILHFEITRENIPLYSVDVAYMIAPETGYIKIGKFSRTTADEFKRAVDQLKESGMTKVILDLRGNGGGYMDAAITIVDEFLEAGKLIVYTEGRRRPRANSYSTGNGKCIDCALVVLIDDFSASASEIVAGAIQDNDRGQIVGRRSFGKGLVQEQHLLSDGSAIRLTIARYYTPTGRSIQKPYDKGAEFYFEEVNHRFDEDYQEPVDSSKTTDSLAFITPGGRVVYGGGGITPDVVVPLDTSGITPYYNQLRSKGLIYRYAFEYTDKNRQTLSRLQTLDAITRHLDSLNVMGQFVNYASQKGISPRQFELVRSKDWIRIYLYAYIARNIIDTKGFYPLLNQRDLTVKKALEVVSQ
jgi:carboxyl-terminal processing protease